MRKLMLCLAVLLCLALPALAQEAQEVTGACTITINGKKCKSAPMTDRDYDTYYTLGTSAVLEMENQAGLSGLYLKHYDRAVPVEVLAEKDGAWVSAGKGDASYLVEWFPLPEGTTRVQLKCAGKGRLFAAEVALYGPGDCPAQVQRWSTLDKADMMLLVAHPDDELLWFGGLLPTYAGQRGLRVQVAYLVPSTPLRRLELLDGLWTCGVKSYPLFGGMRDARSGTLKGQYKLWGKNRVLTTVVEMLRQVKPEVLITQDVNGEYGHGAHRVCADVCQLAVTKAADSASCKASAKEYGVWQVKKLYIHLYGDDPLRMNWREPLSAFGGKDSYTVACEALACHASQVKHGWAMEEGGDMDNSLFGLCYSTVGSDVEKNDLMENINLN